MEKSTNNKPKDSLHTEWYDSGQKWIEVTYKDGELISSRYWYKDGNLRYFSN